MGKKRKNFPLRISEELFRDLKQWADQEMRSVNAQVEFLLNQAIRSRKKSNRKQTGQNKASEEDG